MHGYDIAPTAGLHRLGAGECVSASAILSRAFSHDPLFAFLLPDTATRARDVGRFFRPLLRYGLLYGEVQATSPNLEGVALWLPPKQGFGTIPKMARAGLFLLPLRVGPRCFFQAWRYSEHIGRLRKRHLPAPHWFLQLLGVAPEHQRQGHAARLLRAMLGRIDREQLPCCLDTTKPANLAFYKKFGFQVAAEDRFPGADLHCWLLVRGAGAPCP